MASRGHATREQGRLNIGLRIAERSGRRMATCPATAAPAASPRRRAAGGAGPGGGGGGGGRGGGAGGSVARPPPADAAEPDRLLRHDGRVHRRLSEGRL